MSYVVPMSRTFGQGAHPSAQRGTAAATVAGPVALAVGDLARSVAFYQALGFALAGELGDTAAFLSFTGADRHLVLVGAPGPAPAQLVPERRHVAVRYPGLTALDAAVRHLPGSSVGAGDEALRGVDGTVYLRDPDGHRLALYANAGHSVWPRERSAALRLVQTPPALEAHFVDLARATTAQPAAA